MNWKTRATFWDYNGATFRRDALFIALQIHGHDPTIIESTLSPVNTSLASASSPHAEIFSCL
jgi:hypothetical protein